MTDTEQAAIDRGDDWAAEQIRRQSRACTCPKSYLTYDGPDRDCPVHGEASDTGGDQ